MPRPRPPHLHRQITRHGVFVWYFRRNKGPRIRLRAPYGTPEFEAEYKAAKAGAPLVLTKTDRASTGSLRWMWDRFRETGAWTRLGASTRRQRENIMSHVMDLAGDTPAGNLLAIDIVAGRDKRAATPSQAKGFLVCMRALYRWGLSAGHVKQDPTVGIKAFPKKRGTGFLIWTEDEVARYQARWPIGTKERVWIDVLLYTGLRRGDAVIVGRQHCRTYTIKNDAGELVAKTVATLKTEKGQGKVTVVLPILPILAATLQAGPCGDMAFICGVRGKPYTKESFGNVFKEACVKASVNERFKAAHGIRKVGATRAADNGATVTELDAIFGWEGGDMAALYTQAADKKRASMRAMAMLERTDYEQSIPSPDDVVRAAG